MHLVVNVRQLMLGMWLAWVLYWLISAATAKPTRRRESLGSRLSHVLPLLLGVYLIVWPQLRRAVAIRPAAAGCGGTVLAGAGTGRRSGWASPCGRACTWAGTGAATVTQKQGHELVRSGPYAYVRHPIYTGLLARAARQRHRPGRAARLSGRAHRAAPPSGASCASRRASCASCSPASTSATWRGARAGALHKQLGDLHRVERGALEQLVAGDEQRDRAPARVADVLADAPHQDRVLPGGILRHRESSCAPGRRRASRPGPAAAARAPRPA